MSHQEVGSTCLSVRRLSFSSPGIERANEDSQPKAVEDRFWRSHVRKLLLLIDMIMSLIDL